MDPKLYQLNVIYSMKYGPDGQVTLSYIVDEDQLDQFLAQQEDDKAVVFGTHTGAHVVLSVDRIVYAEALLGVLQTTEDVPAEDEVLEVTEDAAE